MTSQLALLGGRPAVQTHPTRRWPEVLPEDREAVMAVLDRAVISGANAPEVVALEREYAGYHDMRHCLTVNSGTAALHLSAVAAGLEQGDEVLVPALTFIASAMAMSNQLATPVFVDIDPRTFNIDVADAEARITERTRAVVVVHLYGLPADMEEILALADRHGLTVIEDTAQAHGATYRGRKVGTFGHSAAGSFQQTKNVSGGEGGVFMTNDDGAYLAAARLRNFGEDLHVTKFGRFYWSQGIGFNYRNQELSAAFARSQLRRLDHYNAEARRNADYLSKRLDSVPGLVAPFVPDDRVPVWHIYRVKLDPRAVGYTGPIEGLRDRVLRALDAEGVPARFLYDHPLSAHPAFRRPPRAWHPRYESERLADWSWDDTPSTRDVIAGSFIIGDATVPLAIQEESVLAQYGDAAEKVMAGVEELLEAPLKPIDRGPP